MSSPRDYNLPHDDWRGGQLESIQRIMSSTAEYVIVNAPVGSGKSAVGLALSSGGKVRVATSTKSLQVQYGTYPYTDLLFGMGNYKCALLEMFQADMCAYPHNMYNCPVYEDCDYLNQRDIVKASKRQILNYAYLLAATWTREERNRADYLYLDEGHFLPSVVMDRMALDVTPRQCAEWGLPYYPENIPPLPSVAGPIIGGWLEKCIAVLGREEGKLRPLARAKPHLMPKYRAVVDMNRRLEITMEALLAESTYFYIEPSNERLRVAPLVARPFFASLFRGMGKKTVITSATIGDYDTYLGILGIPAERAEFVNVPSNFDPDEMPVYRFKKAPRMSARSGDSAFFKQRNIAVETIKRFPDHNTLVLIHCASKSDSEKFAQMLKHDLGDRVWLPPEKGGTEKKIADWEKRIAAVPNTVCVSWCFGTGLDAPQVRVNLIQKVPFGTLDGYGMAQKDLSPDFYKWMAATSVEQACGRVRRGYNEHYEVEGEPVRKFVGILDNNINMVKKYTSDHFQKCLRWWDE